MQIADDSLAATDIVYSLDDVYDNGGAGQEGLSLLTRDLSLSTHLQTPRGSFLTV
jgi:hypothetical protein